MNLLSEKMLILIQMLAIFALIRFDLVYGIHRSMVTSHPGKLNGKAFNELNDKTNHHHHRQDNDDNVDVDYYSDNDEQSDSVSIDIDIDYASYKGRNWSKKKIFPIVSTTTASPAIKNLKRVPRHPHPHPQAQSQHQHQHQLQHQLQPQLQFHSQQPHRHHLLNDNRVDVDAAFDEEGYQSDQAVGVLTAQKQKEVGTPELVEINRRLYQERTQLRYLANTHKQRIDLEARCRWPQARVIHINNETSKQYSPRATILHRCDETTGCCPDYKVCSVRNSTIVELPFWVKPAGSIRAQAQMVALTNHTECECISLAAQRRKRSSHCQCPEHFINFSNLSWRNVGLSTGCRCDCHLSDATCQRLKNGEEGFAMSERRCIQHNECTAPICNYGVYNAHSGRCPRPSQEQKQQRQQQRQLGFG